MPVRVHSVAQVEIFKIVSMELEGFGTFIFIIVVSTTFIFIMSRGNGDAAQNSNGEDEITN